MGIVWERMGAPDRKQPEEGSSAVKKMSINPKTCRGINLCNECESLHPGIVNACERDGHVLISDQSYVARAAQISLLLARCPTRAIMVLDV